MAVRASFGGSGSGVTTLQGESGAVTLTSSGATVAITTPTGSTINLEAAGSAGVTSLNSQTGAVTLANANGVSWTQAAGTITPALGAITPSSVVASGNVSGSNLSGTNTGDQTNVTGSAGSLSISGQTGLMSVTGLTSTNRIKTVRDAADTILELGGNYTPTGTWTSMTLVTPALGTPASGTLTNCTSSTKTQGDNTTAIATDAFVQTEAGLSTARRINCNGDMSLDFTNAGGAYTNNATTLYTLEQWIAVANNASKFTVQQIQSSSVFPGFNYYKKTTSSAATTVASGDYYAEETIIEGSDMLGLAWGTASAQPITIGFWVQSSLTGTFGGSVANSAKNRCYPFSYTISSANTATFISVTISGDTSGTWLTGYGQVGLRVYIGLGVGSTNSGTAGSWGSTLYYSATSAVQLVNTNAATLYMTGFQVERGNYAHTYSFNRAQVETAWAQRFFVASYDVGVAVATITNAATINQKFATTVITFWRVICTVGITFS